LAHTENGKGELISRNGNVLRGLADLSAWIAEHLRLESAVLDGEIACAMTLDVQWMGIHDYEILR
jgi:ATP-dependent DNA ligase